MKKVIVLCDGNTCRSPTLMLLLRYKARLLGVEHLMQIESAGLGRSAEDGDPMLEVAQKALIHAAGMLEVVTADHELLLRNEASLHQSTKVTVKEALKTGRVVSLLTRKKRKTLDPKGKLHRVNSTIWLPTPDRAFYIYRILKDEFHPDVIKAYEEQAEKLAGDVVTKLHVLFQDLNSP